MPDVSTSLPRAPPPPTAIEPIGESFEHLTFMEYLEICFFSLLLPSAADVNRAIVPVRHSRSDPLGLLSAGTSDFCGRDVAVKNLFGMLIVRSRVARVITISINFFSTERIYHCGSYENIFGQRTLRVT